MPRVVPDQKTKYETDELFKKLSQETDVRYAGLSLHALARRNLCCAVCHHRVFVYMRKEGPSLAH